MSVVNIYFNDISYTKITQVPIVNGVGLLSNIGGVFGLFLGASLLTFMEIFEFLFKVINIILSKD